MSWSSSPQEDAIGLTVSIPSGHGKEHQINTGLQDPEPFLCELETLFVRGNHKSGVRQMNAYEQVKSRRRRNFANKERAQRKGKGKRKQKGISPERQYLIDVWEKTREECSTWEPEIPPVRYDIDELPPYEIPISVCPYAIDVRGEDTLEMARRWSVEEGFERLLVLNMASVYRPGGGVEKGARAQEEHLFRCTTAFRTHRKEWYPLDDEGLIYSPDIRVHRGRAAQGYKLERIRPFTVAMVAVPALRKPRLRGHTEYRYEEDHAKMDRKVEAIFRVAIKYGHKHLVLGALGCGAYRNPVRQVAELFRSKLRLYGGHFIRIGFAILPDGDNLEIFKEVLL